MIRKELGFTKLISRQKHKHKQLCSRENNLFFFLRRSFTPHYYKQKRLAIHEEGGKNPIDFAISLFCLFYPRKRGMKSHKLLYSRG